MLAWSARTPLADGKKADEPSDTRPPSLLRCVLRLKAAGARGCGSSTGQPQSGRHGRQFEVPPTGPVLACSGREETGIVHSGIRRRGVTHRTGLCSTSRQRISRHSPTTPRQLHIRSRRDSVDQSSSAMMKRSVEVLHVPQRILSERDCTVGKSRIIYI